MAKTQLKESSRNIDDANYRCVVKAGTPWTYTIKKGEVWRLIDLGGNQSADVLLYNAHDIQERYDVNATITNQRNTMIALGTTLLSNLDNPMFKVIADTCGDHDTLGSGCSAEGNTIRYTNKARYMHSCRDTFVGTFLNEKGSSKREQTCNLNFFTKVLLDDTGYLEFADGISGAGKYVELVALMDVKVVLSNCSQLNNPCNDYNPTPLEMVIWDK